MTSSSRVGSVHPARQRQRVRHALNAKDEDKTLLSCVTTIRTSRRITQRLQVLTATAMGATGKPTTSRLVTGRGMLRSDFDTVCLKDGLEKHLNSETGIETKRKIELGA